MRGSPGKSNSQPNETVPKRGRRGNEGRVKERWSTISPASRQSRKTINFIRIQGDKASRHLRRRNKTWTFLSSSLSQRGPRFFWTRWQMSRRGKGGAAKQRKPQQYAAWCGNTPWQGGRRQVRRTVSSKNERKALDPEPQHCGRKTQGQLKRAEDFTSTGFQLSCLRQRESPKKKPPPRGRKKGANTLIRKKKKDGRLNRRASPTAELPGKGPEKNPNRSGTDEQVIFLWSCGGEGNEQRGNVGGSNKHPPRSNPPQLSDAPGRGANYSKVRIHSDQYQ